MSDPYAEATLRPDDAVMRAMFIARREVFVDLLKWDLPVLADQFELDHFDAETVKYLILTNPDCRHRASARLLPTDRPHMLIELFRHLCTKPIRMGSTVREITRFCLDLHQSAIERRSARNQLITAIVEHALVHGITDYTGVAEKSWFDQIMTFGWDCEALGPPVRQNNRTLGALHIRIDSTTPNRLRANGIYEPFGLRLTTLEGLTSVHRPAPPLVVTWASNLTTCND